MSLRLRGSVARPLGALLGLALVAAAPASAGFANRKLVTVTGSQVVGGPHASFPVILAVVDAELRLSPLGGVRNAQGCDISFRASDGVTPLDYEIRTYDGATGTLFAFVRLPSIQNGVNTTFYIYYGDPELSCRQTRHGDVWDAGYRAVFHFAETTGNPLDSTANGVAGRLDPQGDPGEVIARDGTALELITPPSVPPATFIPTTDSYLQLADGTLAGNSAFTFEAWFLYHPVNTGQYIGIVTKNRDGCDYTDFDCADPGEDWVGLYKNNGNTLTLGMDVDGGPGNLDGATVLSPDRWYYGAVSYGPSGRRVFLYDTIDAQNATAGNYTSLALPTRIGDDSNGQYLNGFIGETRISTVERSAAWLQTTARNQGCPTNTLAPPTCGAYYPASLQVPFLTVGLAQSLIVTPTDPDCCRVVASDDGTRLTASTSSLSMVFDRTDAGGLTELRAEEEANRTQSRHGDAARYNVFSTQLNDGTWHFERDAAGQIEVLEATPTRLRLRQLYNYTAAIHLQRTWTVSSMPRLAIDERLVLDSDQTIRGAQGLHPRGATSGGASICPSQLITSGFGTFFYCAGQANAANRFFLVTDNHETYGDMLAVAHSTPFFGPTRVGAGIYETTWETGTPETYFARTFEPGGSEVLTAQGTYRNLYLFYPSLAGLTSAGLEWQPYANDYRTPDVLSFNFSIGTGWVAAEDLTAPGDFYNEAEGAYQVDFNPATGLNVNLDGTGATPRRRPLFKIRQWRSFADPTVSLEGTALVADRDFTADVKPFVRAFHCTGPTEFVGCTVLANGGLAGASEYMNDPSGGKNYTLDFPDATTWFYLGAESRFRGINVNLVTPGVGTADLRFEYWNGASWLNLEGTSGWSDQTNNFKQNGTISWGDDALELDPVGWTTLSIGGGPSLYYVRARLDTGSYTTPPVERVMRTDILLFQYCRDVDFADATFLFSLPPTTAVTLTSFTATPDDAAVRLAWRTGSELANLGFHLYRAPTPDGPWTRLTTSLIPGLGSSAEGRAYSFDDTGLSNGTRYFYRLEDVDAASRTTSHGPVSAVPEAPAPEPAPGADDGPRDRNKRQAGASSDCPAWVLTAYTSSLGAIPASLRCTRHGDPEAVSLSVVSRDARQATLELRTGGFYALHAPSVDGPSGAGEPGGTVRVFVPGFDFPQDPLAAALPLRRALVDAVVGRRVALTSVRALDLAAFPGLAPGALGAAEMRVSRDGTVRAARRAGQAPLRVPPGDFARLLPSVFQGETKSAVVVLLPLRYDAQRGQIVLARTLRVRLAFTGRETTERGKGARGRARRPAVSDGGEALARLYTTSSGLHAVSFEQLFPGRGRALPVSQLRLQRLGEAVAFHVEPDGDSFGPGSRLFFVARSGAASTAFSAEVAWELVRASGGLRMPRATAAPSGASLVSAPSGFAAFESNRLYQPGLLEAPDLWLWEGLAGGATRTTPFSLAGVEAASSAGAELEVFLQGASESGQPVDHHVSVSVNGTLVGEAHFAGKRPYRMSLSLPASLLREGTNELAVTNVADTGVASYVLLDRFSLGYPQRAAAAGGRFEGSWSESGSAVVTSDGGALAVVDVTPDADPGGAATWLVGHDAGPRGVSFHAEAGRRYLVVTPAGLLSPRVALAQASTLRATANQADYLLVAPRALLPAAESLLARRADQGLRARAVAFEEIADEFGHGQPSAEAIRSFLAFAFHSWARPSPRYVLLLGDASYDPRNFIGTSKPAPLPGLFTKTAYMWTVSDPLLAAVNGDDALPDIAIGRLPAATLDEASRLVAKLVAWEQSAQGLAGPATLVADNPDQGGDFEANVADIAASFLADRSPEQLRLRELGVATRPRIQEALDSGLAFLSYVGHGGPAVWASENVWNSWDAASLQAQSRQPLLLTMNCLNGYFVAPAFDSLAESLVKPEGRGAIAAFSPSGLSLDGPAHEYHRALMAEITSGRHGRLGDAFLAAQAGYARSGLMPELLGVYHLLGDPAMSIR